MKCEGYLSSMRNGSEHDGGSYVMHVKIGEGGNSQQAVQHPSRYSIYIRAFTGWAAQVFDGGHRVLGVAT